MLDGTNLQIQQIRGRGVNSYIIKDDRHLIVGPKASSERYPLPGRLAREGHNPRLALSTNPVLDRCIPGGIGGRVSV